jgi:osmotically-inducible protein OsmY
MSTEFGAKSLRFLKLGAALALASGASGCATTVVALGASAAAVAVSDKTAGAALDDTATTAEIKAKMLNGKGYSLGAVQVAVYEGFVLLAGSTPTPQDRIEAERRAWTSAGTKNVANEIVVGPGRSVAGVMQDGAISAEIKAKYFRSSVKGVNYKVETSQKTVFLLGIARSRMELTDAVEEARTVGGVQKVVSYVRILDRPVIQQPETAAEAAARRAQEQGLAGGPKPAETLPYAAGEQMPPAQDYSPYEKPSYMNSAAASDPYAPPRNYSAQSYTPPPAPYQAPQMAPPSLPPRYAQPDFNTPKFAKPSSASAQYPRDPQFDGMPDGSPVSGRTLGPASDTFAGEVRPPVPDAAPAAYGAAPPTSYAAAPSTYAAPSSAYAAAPAAPPPVTYAAPPVPGAGPVQLTPP